MKHVSLDSSLRLVLEGGDGNDILRAEDVEFGNNTTLDGGADDDVLETDLFMTGTPGDSFGTFITGAGADAIGISFIDLNGSDIIDAGLMGRVTDFTPGGDIIPVNPSWLLR